MFSVWQMLVFDTSKENTNARFYMKNCTIQMLSSPMIAFCIAPSVALTTYANFNMILIVFNPRKMTGRWLSILTNVKSSSSQKGNLSQRYTDVSRPVSFAPCQCCFALKMVATRPHEMGAKRPQTPFDVKEIYIYM